MGVWILLAASANATMQPSNVSAWMGPGPPGKWSRRIVQMKCHALPQCKQPAVDRAFNQGELTCRKFSEPDGDALRLRAISTPPRGLTVTLFKHGVAHRPQGGTWCEEGMRGPPLQTVPP